MMEIDIEEKSYWIVLFPKNETYKTIFNTKPKAIEWVKSRYPNEEFTLVKW